jgi:RNA polymerase subunit RPABC4/transcription elongation factor Spt4
MALKVCKECGREHSDTIKTCPHCGYVDVAKVIIFGYIESFVVNPDVKIYKDDIQIGRVSKGGKITLDITEPCELKFKSSIRSTKCYVRPGDAVIISFNRTTGRLSATVTKEESAESVININKSADYTRISLVLIICSVVCILMSIDVIDLFGSSSDDTRVEIVDERSLAERIWEAQVNEDWEALEEYKMEYNRLSKQEKNQVDYELHVLQSKMNR